MLRVVALCLLLVLPRPAAATDEYAACTGRSCSHCHESPEGGGALTAAGNGFLATLAAPGGAAPSAFRRALRPLVFFLHVLTAFMWFGTILYVHLILKPAYAAAGLPKGELRLGWASIASIAATGLLLTLWRIDSWHALLQTRFGVLLTVKIALFLVMATTALLVTVVIGPRLGRKRVREGHPGQGDFTAEELARFDGREGRPAFVGHGGNVYDVSGSRMWPQGTHARQHAAGRDLTTALDRAPHGAEKLQSLAVVGRIVPSVAPARSAHEHGFYVMAYLNLGLVAAILLVITLWHI
jgi:predicted heme/steroid binding protein